MMEAKASRPGEADERHHKDREMERDTEMGGEGRGRSSIIHQAAPWLWEGVMRADEGSFKRLQPNWATEPRIRRPGQI